MLMNYARVCNPYSGFSALVNETSALESAEKALLSGPPRHVSHYGLRIKDGRKIEPACGDGNFLVEIPRLKFAAVRSKYRKNRMDMNFDRTFLL